MAVSAAPFGRFAIVGYPESGHGLRQFGADTAFYRSPFVLFRRLDGGAPAAGGGAGVRLGRSWLLVMSIALRYGLAGTLVFVSNLQYSQ